MTRARGRGVTRARCWLVVSPEYTYTDVIDFWIGGPSYDERDVLFVWAPSKQVQRAVTLLYQRLGCMVYSLSQPRATMQSSGLPDLYVFSLKAKAAWWHEVKAADGMASDAQLDFLGRCQLARVGHVMGGVEAAKAHLTALGLIATAGA